MLMIINLYFIKTTPLVYVKWILSLELRVKQAKYAWKNVNIKKNYPTFQINTVKFKFVYSILLYRRIKNK